MLCLLNEVLLPAGAIAFQGQCGSKAPEPGSWPSCMCQHHSQHRRCSTAAQAKATQLRFPWAEHSANEDLLSSSHMGMRLMLLVCLAQNRGGMLGCLPLRAQLHQLIADARHLSRPDTASCAQHVISPKITKDILCQACLMGSCSP